jgi:soluble lytic murein transglycosylase-like protein
MRALWVTVPLVLAAAGPAVAEAPRVLSAADVGRYRQIFGLQRKADFRTADRVIAKLDDPLLLGHVRFQRFMHPAAYRSRFAELRDWLAAYADLPGADRIYDLAMRRRPASAAAPPKPRGAASPNGFSIDDAEMMPHPASPAAVAWRAELEGLLVRGRLREAAKAFDSRKSKQLLDQVDRDRLAGTMAGVRLRRGDVEAALKLAAPAADRSGGQAPNAQWIAGLARWQLGEPAKALARWQALSRAEAANPPLRAAGAFWSARALLRLQRPEAVLDALRRAAGYPRQLYGVVAQAQLGLRPDLNLAPIPGGDAGEQSWADTLLRQAGARRAVALAEIGETRLADLELRHLYFSDHRHLAGPLLALAHALDLPGTQLRIAEAVRAAGGMPPDLALYPVPPWRPVGGFRVDRALLLAIARHESGFEPRAQNPSGASGLLQLMPRTADFANGGSLAGQRYRLLEPAFNLELGQRYIEHLLDLPAVDGDLVRLIAAYNAGPGNTARWLRQVAHGDDPLLFMELIPTRQTRRYVRRVLADVLLYRVRLGQELPGLHDIAQGAWPRYLSLDGKEMSHAR